MATNMKSLNGYGFDAQALGGKAPEYYIQPRNLLDNSDFRNPVNQRGATSYSGIWTYSIDRWVTWLDSSNPATVTVDAGGITPYPGMVIQRIESKYIDSSKIYTLAAMSGDGLLVLSGKITSATQSTTNSSNGISFEYNADSDTYQFVLYSLTSASKFVWAVLYEGEYTAETLPPYVPKGYAAELAECQRYAYLIPPYMAFSGYITSNSKNFTFVVPCPPMRRSASVIPTVTSIPRMTIRTVSGYSPVATQDSPGTPTSLTIQDYSPDSYHMDLCAVFASDIGKNNTPAMAQFRLGDSALISLDL